MANELDDRRIAFMAANEGIEQVELTEPWQAVKDAGGTAELLAPEAGQAQAFNHLDKADTFPVDRPSATLTPGITTRWSCLAAWPAPTSCGRCRRRWSSPGRCSGPVSRPRL